MKEEKNNFAKAMLGLLLYQIAYVICDSIIKPPIDWDEYLQRRLLLMIPNFFILIGTIAYPFIQAYFKKRHEKKIEGLNGAEIEQVKQNTDKIVLWVAGATCFICVGGAIFAIFRRIFKF